MPPRTVASDFIIIGRAKPAAGKLSPPVGIRGPGPETSADRQ
jgi:hypothetical protein